MLRKVNEQGILHDLEHVENQYNDTSGITSGLIKTSKQAPKINFKSEINKKNNEVSIELETENIDNIYINDFKYEVHTLSGYLITEGDLDYTDENVSSKVVKIIQSYTGVVDKMVWRKF